MVFRRRGLGNIINSVKNVVDLSSVLAASTNTVAFTILDTVDATTRGADPEEVPRGSKVTSFYLSLFFASDQNQTGVGEIELVDWYIFLEKGGAIIANGSFGNARTQIPIPGSTGLNPNVNQIIHEEKGLVGEKNDGSKMVFQGVVRIPRGKQRFSSGDTIVVCARSNFATVFCAKAIYKYYQ